MDDKPASLSVGFDTQTEITCKQERPDEEEYEGGGGGFHAPNRPARKRGRSVVALSGTNPSNGSQWPEEVTDSIQRVEGGESLRLLHRRRLWLLLEKLYLQHNWSEANGVLSVLLKATVKDKSPSRNRFKYCSTLQLIRRIKGDNFNQRKTQNIFDLWIKRLGGAIGKQASSRSAVLIEFVLYCLRYGNTEDARQSALCLMQEPGFQSNSLANFVVGLTFYQVWYSAIPKDMQVNELIESSSPMQSPVSVVGSYMSVEKTDQSFSMECESNSSIGNEKIGMIVSDERRENLMQIDDWTEQKTPGSDFHIKPCESSGNEGFSFPNHSDHDDMPAYSIFYSRGLLPPWILPLKMPDSTDDLENFIYRHRNLVNDNYRNAVKHLRKALYSSDSPPMFEAFHPLIQMLLLGDQVNEALNEVENLFRNMETPFLHSRLIQTCLLECFPDDHDTNSSSNIVRCFENMLQKDPTCSDFLLKLISMYRRGDYSIERLVEMIALHLDATFADWNTWQEFASCLFKLSQSNEDEMSTCLYEDENQQQKKKNMVYSCRIPGIFTKPGSETDWRLRCRWWLSRHFSEKNLQADISSDEMLHQLVTYKAAAGTHLYGRQLKYVTKVTEYLERENKSEMLSILHLHINYSVGFYFNLNGKKP